VNKTNTTASEGLVQTSIGILEKYQAFLLGHFCLGHFHLSTTSSPEKNKQMSSEFFFWGSPKGKSNMNDPGLGIHKLDIHISAAGRNLATQGPPGVCVARKANSDAV